MKEMIEVGDSKKYGPYSPGIKSRGIVWLSGQIAPEAGADIKLQTKASLDKIDQLLAAAGINRDAVCFAQVLLADINDTADAQVALNQRLFSINAIPYYLHLLDRVQGAAHFDTAERAALAIMASVTARLPGYMVPRLVREIGGNL